MTSCELCDLRDRVPAALEVHRDDDWWVFVHPEYTRPGCLWIMATMHVEGPWGLTEAQATSFGPTVQKVSAALRDGCQAEKVYLISFGENFAHFHALLIARLATDDEKELRGVKLLSAHLGSNGADADAASALAETLRNGIEIGVVEPS